MTTFSTVLLSTLACADQTAWHTAYLDCGGTHIRALAECYEDARLCVSETLTFTRGGRRAVVGLHKHVHTYHDVPALRAPKVPVLTYTAHNWACLTGASGGHYVHVVMSQTGGGNCEVCEARQLYDLNGRLVAADVTFNATGHARRDESGAALMRRLLGPPRAPQAFASIYRSR